MAHGFLLTINKLQSTAEGVGKGACQYNMKASCFLMAQQRGRSEVAAGQTCMYPQVGKKYGGVNLRSSLFLQPPAATTTRRLLPASQSAGFSKTHRFYRNTYFLPAAGTGSAVCLIAACAKSCERSHLFCANRRASRAGKTYSRAVFSSP